MTAKQHLDQASLHLAHAQSACSRVPTPHPNKAKASIKQTIEDLKEAYTILGGTDPQYRRENV